MRNTSKNYMKGILTLILLMFFIVPIQSNIYTTNFIDSPLPFKDLHCGEEFIVSGRIQRSDDYIPTPSEIIINFNEIYHIPDMQGYQWETSYIAPYIDYPTKIPISISVEDKDSTKTEAVIEVWVRPTLVIESISTDKDVYSREENLSVSIDIRNDSGNKVYGAVVSATIGENQIEIQETDGQYTGKINLNTFQGGQYRINITTAKEGYYQSAKSKDIIIGQTVATMNFWQEGKIISSAKEDEEIKIEGITSQYGWSYPEGDLEIYDGQDRILSKKVAINDKKWYANYLIEQNKSGFIKVTFSVGDESITKSLPISMEDSIKVESIEVSEGQEIILEIKGISNKREDWYTFTVSTIGYEDTQTIYVTDSSQDLKFTMNSMFIEEGNKKIVVKAEKDSEEIYKKIIEITVPKVGEAKKEVFISVDNVVVEKVNYGAIVEPILIITNNSNSKIPKTNYIGVWKNGETQLAPSVEGQQKDILPLEVQFIRFIGISPNTNWGDNVNFEFYDGYEKSTTYASLGQTPTYSGQEIRNTFTNETYQDIGVYKKTYYDVGWVPIIVNPKPKVDLKLETQDTITKGETLLIETLLNNVGFESDIKLVYSIFSTTGNKKVTVPLHISKSREITIPMTTSSLGVGEADIKVEAYWRDEKISEIGKKITITKQSRTYIQEVNKVGGSIEVSIFNPEGGRIEVKELGINPYYQEVTLPEKEQVRITVKLPENPRSKLVAKVYDVKGILNDLVYIESEKDYSVTLSQWTNGVGNINEGTYPKTKVIHSTNTATVGVKYDGTPRYVDTNTPKKAYLETLDGINTVNINIPTSGGYELEAFYNGIHKVAQTKISGNVITGELNEVELENQDQEEYITGRYYWNKGDIEVKEGDANGTPLEVGKDRETSYFEVGLGPDGYTKAYVQGEKFFLVASAETQMERFQPYKYYIIGGIVGTIALFVIGVIWSNKKAAKTINNFYYGVEDTVDEVIEDTKEFIEEKTEKKKKVSNSPKSKIRVLK